MDLKSIVRKDVQVRILPPLPSLGPVARRCFKDYRYLLGLSRPPVGFRRRGAMIIVNAYFNGWPNLFPQHGPGRKHERAIVLDAWQREIVGRHPAEFARGCVDSDGCRHQRIVAKRNYPAYSFANASEDILGIFTWACDLLGVRWRRANRHDLARAAR